MKTLLNPKEITLPNNLPAAFGEYLKNDFALFLSTIVKTEKELKAILLELYNIATERPELLDDFNVCLKEKKIPSFLSCARYFLAIGLKLNSNFRHCAFVPRKIDGVKKTTPIVQKNGLLYLAACTNLFLESDVRVVYEGEVQNYDIATGVVTFNNIDERLIIAREKNKKIGYYSHIHFLIHGIQLTKGLFWSYEKATSHARTHGQLDVYEKMQKDKNTSPYDLKKNIYHNNFDDMVGKAVLKKLLGDFSRTYPNDTNNTLLSAISTDGAIPMGNNFEFSGGKILSQGAQEFKHIAQAEEFIDKEPEPTPISNKVQEKYKMYFETLSNKIFNTTRPNINDELFYTTQDYTKRKEYLLLTAGALEKITSMLDEYKGDERKQKEDNLDNVLLQISLNIGLAKNDVRAFFNIASQMNYTYQPAVLSENAGLLSPHPSIGLVLKKWLNR